MGNCLVTRLKGVVNNDNLPLFNRLRFKGVFNNNDGYYALGSAREDISVVNNTTELRFSNPYTGWFYTQSSGEAIFQINNKYNLQDLQGNIQLINGAQDLTSLPNLTSIAIGSFTSASGVVLNANVKKVSDLNVLPGLTSIMVSDSEMSGNVEDLLPVFGNTLEKLIIKSYGVTQTMASLGKFKALSDFGNPLYTTISGAIEDYAASKVYVGVSQGTLSRGYLGARSSITFMGNTIQNESTGEVSWAPNSLDSSKTDVTYNGTTTTIIVASDGTWTRVS